MIADTVSPPHNVVFACHRPRLHTPVGESWCSVWTPVDRPMIRPLAWRPSWQETTDDAYPELPPQQPEFTHPSQENTLWLNGDHRQSA